MRRHPRILVLALLSTGFCLLAGAVSRPPEAASAQNSFFPLHPRNVWVYLSGFGQALTVRVHRSLGNPQDPTTAMEVTGYFPDFFDSVRLLRTSSDDVVTEVLADGSERLYYRLGEPVGSSWVMQVPGVSCSNGVRVTVGARDLTLTVPAGTFDGVVRLDFGIRCFDSGIRNEWFAPGVGLIRRVEDSLFGARTSELTEFKTR